MANEPLKQGIHRLSQSVRWRLGMRVAAPELEAGDDDSVASFYRGRVTDCSFLDDPNHYEYPRAAWLRKQVRGGRLLEIGCGNGGMTRLLAPQVDRLVALDVSTPSLAAVNALGLPNVETSEALVEHYQPRIAFDWIVMSEVIEHLRRPGEVVAQCVRWLAPGGSLLITTPNGHWESNEHLQEWTMDSFSEMLGGAGGESIAASYLRDRDERRRWLVGRVSAPEREPTQDDFTDRQAVARRRRS